jgi:GTPase
MDSSLDTLQEMARRLTATVQVLRQRKVDPAQTRTVAEILVRKVPEDQQAIDLSVCVLGSADVGKSTLLGVLTQGELDNGRGAARLNMFRHLHEIQSGRTSSISHEILGFDSTGNPVDYSNHGTAEEICEAASKLITFIDLAGHHKYLHTTISALTGYCPHYVMLVVSASAGVVGMTQEHLGIAVALEVPFFVVVTKMDMVPAPRLDTTLTTVTGILKSAGAHKVPLVVKSSDDCITAAANQLKNNIVPIFCVSSVEGTGLERVKQFLHLLPPGVGQVEASKLEQELPEFQVDELFDVPGVGTVAGGLVTQGIIVENMALKVGPFEDGGFKTVKVSSIRRNKAACRLVRAQQSAALALDLPISQLRRGMVATSPQGEQPVACIYFQASVCVLFHPTEILRGFRTTVHIGNIRQTAVIEGIQPLKGLKSSDQASVMFKFIKNPEFVKSGARILFREGRTKGIGQVTQVFPFEYNADR